MTIVHFIFKTLIINDLCLYPPKFFLIVLIFITFYSNHVRNCNYVRRNITKTYANCKAPSLKTTKITSFFMSLKTLHLSPSLAANIRVCYQTLTAVPRDGGDNVHRRLSYIAHKTCSLPRLVSHRHT